MLNGLMECQLTAPALLLYFFYSQFLCFLCMCGVTMTVCYCTHLIFLTDLHFTHALTDTGITQNSETNFITFWDKTRLFHEQCQRYFLNIRKTAYLLNYHQSSHFHNENNVSPGYYHPHDGLHVLIQPSNPSTILKAHQVLKSNNLG